MKIFLNWKQNGSYSSILSFFTGINKSDAEVAVFLPFPFLGFANFGNNLSIGAQNVSPFKNGAFTGEVGGEMLKEAGVKFCLVGHSERRKYFNETNAELANKIKLLSAVNIKPVLCVGEELSERKNKTFFETLKRQMEVFQSNIIVAYEPIWAIGSGLVPSLEEIAEVAEFFDKNYKTEVLYGGSVSESNIKEIVGIKNINGVLVGGASLDYKRVNKMLEAI